MPSRLRIRGRVSKLLGRKKNSDKIENLDVGVCPICNNVFPLADLNQHASNCNQYIDNNNKNNDNDNNDYNDNINIHIPPNIPQIQNDQVKCPLCDIFFDNGVIAEHASKCIGKEQNRSIEIPPPIPEKPEKLEKPEVSEPIIPSEITNNSPFAIACPYPGNCGFMEACDFPVHVESCHKDSNIQKLQCPICALQMDSLPPLTNNFSLINHLNEQHSDLVPSFNYAKLTESALLDDVQVGTVTVEDIIKEDITDKECIICFDNYYKGDEILRLDCWCFFHKECIEGWFDKVGQIACPVHKRDTEQ